MDTNVKQHMLDFGYIVVPADNVAPLNELRDQIFQKAQQIFAAPEKNAADFFDQFHRLGVSGAELNERRLRLIRECTDEINSGTLIHQAFEQTLLALLGPDLLVQRTTNLVIQQPGDPNPSELHRDSPGNSPYEAVVWLPLTDSYGTKAMYVLDRKQTEGALVELSRMESDWEAFEKHCTSVAKTVDVPYGSALIFWPGIFHGSFINQESETRWTLNMRYKNLFAPLDKKEPFEFFKILQLSPLTQLAIDFQKREALR
jgi:sporadic carbohydrate cluster 2OG-Fe(II) oxygenase